MQCSPRLQREWHNVILMSVMSFLVSIYWGVLFALTQVACYLWCCYNFGGFTRYKFMDKRDTFVQRWLTTVNDPPTSSSPNICFSPGFQTQQSWIGVLMRQDRTNALEFRLHDTHSHPTDGVELTTSSHTSLIEPQSTTLFGKGTLLGTQAIEVVECFESRVTANCFLAIRFTETMGEETDPFIDLYGQWTSKEKNKIVGTWRCHPRNYELEEPFELTMQSVESSVLV